MLRYMMHNCPINCLFATEALPGFGTISQSVSRRGDAHLVFPRPSSLSCPPSSFPPALCLCTEAESSGLIAIIWMRDGVIISQVPSPRPPPPLEGGGAAGGGWGALLPWRPRQIGQRETSQSKVVGFLFVSVWFFPLHDRSDKGSWRVRRGSDAVMRQL